MKHIVTLDLDVFGVVDMLDIECFKPEILSTRIKALVDFIFKHNINIHPILNHGLLCNLPEEHPCRLDESVDLITNIDFHDDLQIPRLDSPDLSASWLNKALFELCPDADFEWYTLSREKEQHSLCYVKEDGEFAQSAEEYPEDIISASKSGKLISGDISDLGNLLETVMSDVSDLVVAVSPETTATIVLATFLRTVDDYIKENDIKEISKGLEDLSTMILTVISFRNNFKLSPDSSPLMVDSTYFDTRTYDINKTLLEQAPGKKLIIESRLNYQALADVNTPWALDAIISVDEDELIRGSLFFIFAITTLSDSNGKNIPLKYDNLRCYRLIDASNPMLPVVEVLNEYTMVDKERGIY